MQIAPIVNGDILTPPNLGFDLVSLRGGWTLHVHADGLSRKNMGYSITDAEGLYRCLSLFVVKGPWRLRGLEAIALLQASGPRDDETLVRFGRLVSLEIEELLVHLWKDEPLPREMDIAIRRYWALRTRTVLVGDEGPSTDSCRPALTLCHVSGQGWSVADSAD